MSSSQPLVVGASKGERSLTGFLKDLLSLTKPRLSAQVMFTVAGGLWLSQTEVPVWRWVVALLATAVVALAFAGRSFLPEFREGTLTIAAVTLPGTSLAESDAMGRRIEQILLRHPEVVSVARRTGRAELDEHAQGVNAAELDV